MLHRFKQEQFINRPLTEVWTFFSDTRNLEILTPEKVKLKNLYTELPYTVHKGQMLIYSLRPILNIPFKWTTKITEVKAGELFIDEQLRGPYGHWRHEHYFQEQDRGTLMIDIVHYKMPFYLPSFMVDLLGLHKRLKEIFEYRKAKIKEILG
jgi:ligand-binding SRPBCC domain-containing protein